MKKKLTMAFVFICSLLIFVISVNLFANMGIYADEYNTTPSVICGGEFGLFMDWLRLALSGVVTLVSGIHLFTAIKNK